MIKTYSEAVQYLYANLPVFQRVGAVAYKQDLTNTLKLCAVLDNPQHKFKSIHVAGTNGKGSTSHMLASILQSAGYKTGLYTSPHLKDFTERIKINGVQVSEQFVVDFVNKIQPAIEDVKPSFFEITVAMAFDYFAQEKIEIAVIEVGLGGRLDSTNVIDPILSVITNIGWDHKDLLGDTLEKIAIEKAGIIKTHRATVVSERQQQIAQVFTAKALQHSSSINFASDEYEIKSSKDAGTALDVFKNGSLHFKNINLPLYGQYQKKNLAGVLKAVDVLNDHGFKITDQVLLNGLENVVAQTGLKGRWQTLQYNPLVICDTGHNIDGVREVLSQISAQSFNKLHMVWGMVKDKDISEVLAELPKHAHYYFCQAKIPRAMDAAALAEAAMVYGLQGEIIPDINEAKRKAISNASKDDFIFIGGSTFVVAEIEEL